MKVNVLVRETIERIVEVEAETMVEALTAVNEDYNNGKLDVASGDYENTVEFLPALPKPYFDDRAGVCPICGHKGLDYSVVRLMDDGAFIPWSCPHCGAYGDEGIEMRFDGHHYNVVDGQGNVRKEPSYEDL